MDIEIYNKFVDVASRKAVEIGASDIHISAGDRLCYRSKGLIVREDGEPLSREDTIEFYKVILNMLSKRDKKYVDYLVQEIECHGHIGFSIEIDGNRYRGNVAKHNGGYYIVMRMLHSTAPDMHDLGFSDQAVEGLESVLSKSAGLFLVTGATGSGKTTTLASIVKEINKRFTKNIITMEDPIEYIHAPIKSHIVQKEKGVDFSDFNEALRSALREDPDIVLVGEIRDGETLELALELAETGHLVFGTLHTQSVVNTIGRMVSMSPHKDLTRDKLANSLLGILTQKLYLQKDGSRRRLLYELLVLDKGSANMIRENKDHQIGGTLDTIKYSNSFNRCIKDAYKRGYMSREDALALSPDAKNLNLDEEESVADESPKDGDGDLVF